MAEQAGLGGRVEERASTSGGSWRRWLSLVACATVIVAIYAPTLRQGFVAEDYQIALKGAKVLDHPGELLQPFQKVWRPAAFGSFAALVGIFGDRPEAFRAVRLAVTVALAALGLPLLRRLGRCSPTGAVVLCLFWQVSPLFSELICGETLFLGHQIFAAAILVVLLVRCEHGGARRQAVLVAAGIVAAASSEQWVVLPAILAVQDVLVLGRPWRRALHTLMAWGGAAAAYVVVYGIITGFGYSSFYSFGPSLVAAKSIVIAASFFQLIQPVPWEFAAFLRLHPWVAVAAPLLLAGLVTYLVRARRRDGLFLLAGAVLLLLPTLPNAGFAGRWSALPWLLFLGAVAHPLAAAWRLERGRAAVRVALTLAGGIVLAGALLTVRGDVSDWGRVDALTRQLAREVSPLVEEGHSGRPLVVFRYGDSRPWLDMLDSQRGQPKVFMPRPDDPYGVVSLSALLTWCTYREGLAWERIAALPSSGGVAVYAHETGGFRRLPGVPAGVAAAIASRGPSATAPFTGVLLLRPTPWDGFGAREFP
jgi:hypothetical protein